MTQQDKVKKFKEIVEMMAKLYKDKNENYGDSFGELYKKLGPTSGLVPLYNKLNRLTELVNHIEENKFESIEDTIVDLACYSVMNLIEWEEYKKGEEEKND